MEFRGGGATRKTGSCCDLTSCHSEPSGEESHNTGKNRPCPADRSDESRRTPHILFRHSDGSQSLSMPINLIWRIWHQKCRKAAFTMAEVLITLGIIGIVAAMTLPALITNHRKQVMLTKVKQTYNILNNALERAKVDYDTEVNNWYIPTSGSQLEKSMFFVEAYMLPYLQTTTYCKDKPTEPYCLISIAHLKEGKAQEVIGPVNNNAGTSFVLNNGTVVGVKVGQIAALNPGDPYDETINRVLITFDIDGPQGYNKKGYDVFMIELGGAEGPNKKNNADKNKFLPYIYDTSKDCDYYVSDINHACNKDAIYSGSMCLAYIVCNGWDFGNNYPW